MTFRLNKELCHGLQKKKSVHIIRLARIWQFLSRWTYQSSVFDMFLWLYSINLHRYKPFISGSLMHSLAKLRMILAHSFTFYSNDVHAADICIYYLFYARTNSTTCVCTWFYPTFFFCSKSFDFIFLESRCGCHMVTFSVRGCRLLCCFPGSFFF